MSTTTRTFESIAEAMAFCEGLEMADNPAVCVRVEDTDPWTVHIDRGEPREPTRSAESEAI